MSDWSKRNHDLWKIRQAQLGLKLVHSKPTFMEREQRKTLNEVLPAEWDSVRDIGRLILDEGRTAIPKPIGNDRMSAYLREALDIIAESMKKDEPK
jgi:hypothetical protein